MSLLNKMTNGLSAASSGQPRPPERARFALFFPETSISARIFYKANELRAGPAGQTLILSKFRR